MKGTVAVQPACTQRPDGGEAVVSQLQLYWWRGGFARVCRLKGRAACRARESIGRQEVSAWFSGNNFAPTRRLSGMRSTATTATVLRELKYRSFYFLCLQGADVPPYPSAEETIVSLRWATRLKTQGRDVERGSARRACSRTRTRKLYFSRIVV